MVRVVEKLDNNIYLAEIKNKLSLNDRLEILLPDSIEECAFNIEELYDVKNNQKVESINPGVKGQQIKIKIPYDLKPGTIIRRKK